MHACWVSTFWSVFTKHMWQIDRHKFWNVRPFFVLAGHLSLQAKKMICTPVSLFVHYLLEPVKYKVLKIVYKVMYGFQTLFQTLHCIPPVNITRFPFVYQFVKRVIKLVVIWCRFGALQILFFLVQWEVINVAYGVSSSLQSTNVLRQLQETQW